MRAIMLGASALHEEHKLTPPLRGASAESSLDLAAPSARRERRVTLARAANEARGPRDNLGAASSAK